MAPIRNFFRALWPSSNGMQGGWAQFLMPMRSDAGITVTPHTAMTLTAFWQAVNIIAGDVGMLPVYCYKRGPNDSREWDGLHYGGWTLSKKPNAVMKPIDFKIYLMQSALIQGNGYAHILRDYAMRPQQLIPLPPEAVSPEINDERLIYKCWINGKQETIPARDMLHIKGMGNGIEGLSVVQMARDTIGLGKAAENHGSKLFSQYAMPQGILHSDGPRPKPDVVDQMLQDWSKMVGGDNRHGIGMTWMGLKFQPISLTNKDAQFLELRQFQRSEIASWFNLPAHMLNDLERATFSNIEHQNIQYLNRCLNRWLTQFEQEANDKLLTEVQKQRDSHYFEFSREALLKGDIEARYRAYDTGIKGGWLNRNEVRRAENLNSVEGLDEYLLPMNTATISQHAEMVTATATPPAVPQGEPEEDDEEDDTTARAREVVRAMLDDLIATEVNRVVSNTQTTKNFVSMVDDFYGHWKTRIPKDCDREAYAASAKEFWLAIADQATPENLLDLVKQGSHQWRSKASEMIMQQLFPG